MIRTFPLFAAYSLLLWFVTAPVLAQVPAAESIPHVPKPQLKLPEAVPKIRGNEFQPDHKPNPQLKNPKGQQHLHGEEALNHSRIKSVSAAMPTVRFVENKGQWNDNIRYRLRLGANTVYVENNRLKYQLINGEQLAQLHPGDPSKLPFKTMDAHVYDVEFRNANPHPVLDADGAFELKENYFLGNDESRWARDVKSYSAIEYSELYDGINLRMYGKGRDVEYDFILQPNARAESICLDYNGVEGLWVDAEGRLHIQTSVGEVIEHIPLAYQMSATGEMLTVACQYRLNADKSIGFDLPEGYDRNAALIIDPVLVFSTFTGSTDDNWGMTATFDANGALYSGGIVNNTDGNINTGYPTTTGAYQVRFAGGSEDNQGESLWYAADMAIVKYSPDGTRIEFATYLGGRDNEQPQSIICNNLGELFILGSTRSENFPATTGAYQQQLSAGFGDIDMVIARLSADGRNLLGSTYLGGSGFDGVNRIGNNPLYYFYADDGRGDIMVDNAGSVFVASSTGSPNFPTPGNPWDRKLDGDQDAIVFKMSDDMRNLRWATYVGGSGMDAGYSIEVDANGHIVVAGGTSSSNLPGMQNGWQRNNSGGSADGFVYRIHKDGNAILNGTYVGTSQYDQVYFVELDQVGNVYFTGQTTGNYPTGNTSFNKVNGKQFVTKLNPEMSQMIYSFRYGSGVTSRARPDITPTAFLIDDCENIFVAGWGSSARNLSPVGQSSGSGNNSQMDITPDAFQRTSNESGFYLMGVIKDGQRLHYGTYFGGMQADDHVDGGTSRFDKRGVVYHSVCANCRLGQNLSRRDFPTTPGVWSETNNSNNCNNASFKFDFQESPHPSFVPPGEGCAPYTISFQNSTRNGQRFRWDFGDSSAVNTQTNPTHTFTKPGTYRISLWAENENSICKGVDSTVQEIIVRSQGGADFNVRVDSCTGRIVCENLSDGQSFLWTWGNNQSSTNRNPPAIVISRGQSVTIRLISEPNSNCADTLSRTVSIPAPSVPVFTYRQPDCGLTVEFTDRSTGTQVTRRSWSFGDGNTSTATSPRHIYAQPGTYRVTLILNPNSACPDSVSQTIVVEPGPDAVFRAEPIQCSRTVQPVNSSKNATSYQWSFGDGSPARTEENPSYTYLIGGDYVIQLVALGRNGCRDTATQTIRIVDPVRAEFSAQTTRCNPLVGLTNNSQDAFTYDWDFGNGNTSTQRRPQPERYNTPGTYNITLVVNGQTPCPNLQQTLVRIMPKAEAIFDIDTVLCTSTKFFISRSLNSTGFAWDFGDNAGTGTGVQTDYTYLQPGTYTVTMIANPTDALCADTATGRVRIPIQPTAAFLPRYTPCTYDVSFTNQSTNASNYRWDLGAAGNSNLAEPVARFPGPGTYRIELTAQPNGECPKKKAIFLTLDTLPEVKALNDSLSCSLEVAFRSQTLGVQSLQWQFGDGNFSSQANPTHLYNESGRYTVSLIGRREGQSCPDTSRITIQIPDLPTARFLPRYVPCSFKLLLDNSSEKSSTYLWDLGNGQQSRLEEPEAVFPGPGRYLISLIANPESICPSQRSITVVLDSLPEVTAASVPYICSLDVPFTAQASATDTLYWQFGDGATAQQLNLTHTYPAPGRYTALLIGRRRGNACSDTARVPVYIPNMPDADFLPQYIGCTYEVRMNNLSQRASTFRWSDGIGNILTQESPNIQFPGPGNYNVSLIVDADSLCPDARSITLRLDSLPEATAQGQRIDCTREVAFTGNIKGADSWRWEFGDGNSATDRVNRNYTYMDPGTYTARLIAERTGNACKDTALVNVNIPQLPIADFTVQYEPCTYRATLVNKSRFAQQYRWDLGQGGGTVTTTDAQVNFPGPGNYTVTLIAEPFAECPDLKTITLRLDTIPIAEATATPVDCTPTVQFGGQTIGADSLIWHFGDGNSVVNVPRPVHSYADPGDYTVTLIAIRTGKACRDTATVDVSVPTLPKSDYTYSKIPCTYRVAFQNKSLRSTQYQWDFGFGNPVTLSAPGTIEFPRSGTYRVSLTADPQSGCPDVKELVVVIDSLPVVSATFTQQPCSPEVQFSSVVSTVDEYIWNFGDGATRRNQTSPLYSYPAPGNYTVRLVGRKGTCADTIDVPVSVPVLPRSVFTMSWDPCRSYVDFTSRSTGSETLLWDLGDGQFMENSTAFRHPYPQPGTYNIRLTAVAANGCVHVSEQQIRLIQRADAAFTLRNDICSPLITLTNSSQFASDYLWTFGDGKTSVSAASPFDYTYARAGTYTVRLIARPGHSCADTAERQVQIFTVPVVRFDTDTTWCSPDVGLTNRSMGTDQYRWEFGDGNTANTEQPGTYRYAQPGTYRIRLTAGTGTPCPRIDSTQITVTAKPAIAYTATVPKCSDDLLLVNSSGMQHFSQRWNFGDGATSTERQPLHAYENPGTYTVRLTLDAGSPCAQILERSVVVDAVPVARFDAQPATCTPEVVLTNRSVRSQSRSWSLGDGNTSTASNPKHTYARAGTYTVQLVVEGSAGCRDTATQEVAVREPSVSAFRLEIDTCRHTVQAFSEVNNATKWIWSAGHGNQTLADAAIYTYTYPGAGRYTLSLRTEAGTPCENNSQKTFNLPELPAAVFVLEKKDCSLEAKFASNCRFTERLLWDFGDGQTSEELNPTHIYESPGSYNVQLQAFSAEACMDLEEKGLNISTHPDGTWQIPDPLCTPDLSVIADYNESTTRYLWYINDTLRSTEATLNYRLSGTGEHRLRLVVEGEKPCRSVRETTLRVLEPPVADLALTQEPCSPTVGLRDRSQGAASVFWELGDNTTSDASSWSHTFTANGRYKVHLTATTAEGCTDDTTMYVQVGPFESIEIDATSNPCTREVVLMGTSNGASTWTWNFGDGNTAKGNPTLHQFEKIGMYTVELVVDEGTPCEASKAYDLSFQAPPKAGIQAKADLCGGYLILKNTSNPDLKYEWLLPDGSKVTSKDARYPIGRLKAFPVQLTVTDANGCTDVMSFTYQLGNGDLEMLSLPNVFTPNGDNLNETLKFPGEYYGCIEGIMIFNRWGVKVFESDKLSTEWNGTFEGKVVQEGAYVMVVKIGGLQYVGTVTVLR